MNPYDVTKVRATIELTTANGNTKTHTIEVDNNDPGFPLECIIDASVDVHDITDVTVDCWRRLAPGTRGTFKVQLTGRGPIQKRGS